MTMTRALSPVTPTSRSQSEGAALAFDESLFLAVAGAMVIGAHALLWRGAVGGVSLDEGYLGAFGLRLIDGHFLPYVDAVSHRGPLLYAMAAAFQWCFGKFEWAGLRLLAGSLSLASVAGCYAVGRASDRPRAGAIAAALLSFILCACSWYQAGLSVDGELASLPFALAATAVTLAALRRPLTVRRDAALVVAGLLAALAALTKQTAVVVGLVLMVGCLARSLEKRAANVPSPFRDCGTFALGFSGPVVLLVVIYAWVGQLPALNYWLFRYNAEIYLDPYRGAEAVNTVLGWWSRSQFAAVFSVGVAMAALTLLRSVGRATSLGLVPLARAYFAALPEMTVSLLVVSAFAAAMSPLRVFPHYFILLYPWLALELGFFIDARWPTWPLWHRARFVLPALMLVVFAGRLKILATTLAMTGLAPDGSAQVCDALDRYSKKGDAIAVWGFDADIYVTCERAVATKFVFSTPVLGVVPPRFGRQRDRWVVPGARAEMAAELEHTRPAVVLENVGRFFGKGMAAVPELGRVLDRDYCPREQVDERNRSFVLYTRKEHGC